MVPDPEIGGLPIYAIIDNLLQQGNFETLSKIALLATDPNSFDNYYTARVDKNINSNIQKRLRTTHQNQNSSGSIAEDGNTQRRVKVGQSQQDEQRPRFYFGKV